MSRPVTERVQLWSPFRPRLLAGAFGGLWLLSLRGTPATPRLRWGPSGNPSAAAECVSLKGAELDSAIPRMTFAESLVAGLPSAAVSLESQVLAVFAIEDHDSMVVVLGWSAKYADISFVALVRDSCLWWGGGRATGWGAIVDPRAQERWNQAFKDVGNRVVIANASVAWNFTRAYLTFATGFPAGIAVSSDPANVRTVGPRGAHAASVPSPVAATIVLAAGDWTVEGQWEIGSGLDFRATIGSSGVIKSFSLRAHQPQ